ncbi:histidine triad (HIT) protein [Thermobaculum terrenum ATCC BAA-798]|uniref:Histidine triad (HIT) protein n=1 Tax=Thermobaculum terrenum (strain ATCC BAA-798 / CCMEE 7001 / YNP1) TaxID=525904 RepID=D1CIB5_THET1|nr:HIT domain-containing protein [Thermobaculum terrenum]ACZ43486.1 histidine triad (HIT) protein [Thermobaculum terrenum ATCC BAA-798]
MQRLWSGWRSEYVTGNASSDGCIFCRFPQEERDEGNLLLHRGDMAYIILNRFPYNPGHVMVVPYEHIGRMADLPPQTMLEMMRLVQLCVGALERGFGAQGFNIGMNLGRCAGAGVPDHLHIHVVPRWVGDVNFMPSLADVKVIPERLEESYHKLKEALADELRGAGAEG